MINSEKLSLFKVEDQHSVGFNDVVWQFDTDIKLINDGDYVNPQRSTCTAVCDGTIVAPCGCVRVVPNRSTCTAVCDGTIVAPCGCVRVIPHRSTCTAVCDGTIVAACGCMRVIP